MATSTTKDGAGLTPSQVLSLIIGIAFTLVGVVGFVVTGTDGFVSANTGNTLLGFELNPMHNIVHLVIGIAGLMLWRTDAGARMYGWLLFAAYSVVFVYGLFVSGSDSGANFLSLNANDNGLHLVSALAGLAAAVLPASSTATGRHSSGPAPV